ncbi:MAG: hypothetical protein AB7V58_11025 [Solirubrobacterales bacterium]
MSILDDAIREHLELKRAHGADEAELKRLEDEAFGPAERPGQLGEQVDPFAEAPTEFLATPDEAPQATPTDPPSGGRQLPNIADLQEPPPKPVAPEENAEDADTEGPGDQGEGPGDQAAGEESEGPDDEQHPAMEHQTIAQPAPEDKPAPPSDELQPDPEAPGAEPAAAERHAAVEQPTELFDVEGQFEDAAESASPSDEQLLDAERSEPPRLGPVDPLAEIEDSGREVEVSGPDREDPEDEFDEFFSEQRLSDELNQALEAPLPDEPEDSAEYDLPEESGEHDVPDHPREEADSAEEYQPHEPGHADALEDTPEFLEESPEDDDAWFEQRPPKDFDFGD